MSIKNKLNIINIKIMSLFWLTFWEVYCLWLIGPTFSGQWKCSMSVKNRCYLKQKRQNRSEYTISLLWAYSSGSVSFLCTLSYIFYKLSMVSDQGLCPWHIARPLWALLIPTVAMPYGDLICFSTFSPCTLVVSQSRCIWHPSVVPSSGQVL